MVCRRCGHRNLIATPACSRCGAQFTSAMSPAVGRSARVAPVEREREEFQQTVNRAGMGATQPPATAVPSDGPMVAPRDPLQSMLEAQPGPAPPVRRPDSSPPPPARRLQSSPPPPARRPYGNGRRCFYGTLWSVYTLALFAGGIATASKSAGPALLFFAVSGLAGWYAYRIWTYRARRLLLLILF